MASKHGWLVLRRRVGDRLFIGDTEVHVRKIARGEVSLAFRTPTTVSILRGEVVDQARLPAGDTGTVSPPRRSVRPDPKGGAECDEGGGSHPVLERIEPAAIDLFDALKKSLAEK